MRSSGSAGRKRVSLDGIKYEIPADEELTLMALAARLVEARTIVGAVTADARVAVRAAAEAGMSERAIARALGVHRRTVANWRATDDGEERAS